MENSNQTSTTVNKSLEPYGQLVKMLLPRALSIEIFGPAGEKYWSSSDVVSHDLSSLIAEARYAVAGAEEGLFRLLDDGTPVYLFRLCEEAGELIALLSVTCRSESGESRPWSFVHSLLRPALECLQREIIAQLSIGSLSRSLEVRDKDLDLLLSISSDAQQGTEETEDDTDELRWIVQRSIEHLGCPFGALVIPEKGIAICRAGHGAPAAQSAEVLTRTHRHLLTWAQLQGKTLVVNKVVASSAPTALPYKILSCPVRQSSSRVVGFFALFRTEEMDDFDHRHTRIARLLARKTAAVLQANYDSATGLLTRPAFERHANANLTRAGSETHCLVYIDIDQMHLINENFGMHIGDAVIARVAELVRRTHHPRVVGARLAGDRFALLLPDCDLDTGTAQARKLCDSARLLRAEGSKDDSPDVSLSIGVAALAGSQAKLAHAMAAAEVACKAAKDRGRNRVETYEEADVSIIRRHTDIGVAAQLRDALRTGRFRLDLQPIVPLQDARKEPHFELLLRMIADDGHSIPPEKFLSAAARYQLMPAIDRWVVEHAVQTLSEQASLLRQHSICFTINLSGQSIAQPDFADFVENAVRSCALPSESFCFELTETAAVANMGRAETFMERLREIGCQFALDDFGTGFSSLAYLKALPVTMLKIDGSFVRDVIVDPTLAIDGACHRPTRSDDVHGDGGGIRGDRRDSSPHRIARCGLWTGLLSGQAATACASAQRAATAPGVYPPFIARPCAEPATDRLSRPPQPD